MNRPIDLWALRIFMEVAITGSMTRAARRLGLTQSAVSQAIRKLESSIGAPLIARDVQPFAPTPAGALTAHRAAALLAEAERLPMLVREAAGAQAEEIRLGFVDTFASTAGPHLIRALTGMSKRVVLWSGLSGSLEEALAAREVDAIITSDPLVDRDGLRRFTLCRESFVLLVPRSLALPEPLTLARLAALLPMIRFSARSHAGRQVEQHLRRLGLAVERRLEVDGADAVAAMVAAGTGWAITTPLALLQGAGAMTGARAVPLPAPGFSRSLTLVCRDDGDVRMALEVARAATAVLRETCVPRIAAISEAIGAAITAAEILPSYVIFERPDDA